MSEYKIFWKKSKKCLTNRFYSAIIDYADLRGCWNRQTGKLEVLVSVLACGFKSHFPHQCKGHSIFGCPLFLYLVIIESEFSDNAEGEEIFKKHLTLKLRYDIISTLTIWQRIKYAGVAELRQIFDLVVAELVPQADSAQSKVVNILNTQVWRNWQTR